MANYCLVDPANGGVTGKVIANNGLRTGAKLWLWKYDGSEYVPVEKHQGATGAIGEFSFVLKIKSIDLESLVLSWVLNSCSSIYPVEKASVKVEFYQQGIKLKTTSDIRYYNEYPKCEDGQAKQNSGQVIYSLISQPKIEMLWTNMD